MIIRLLGTILSLVVLAFFVGFNLDNKCNVNVLVHTFQNVPVFITIIISFVVGVLFTMPFAFSYKSQKKKEAKNNQVQVVDKTDGSNKCAVYKENEETLYVCRNQDVSATIQDIVTELAKNEINSKDTINDAELNDFKAVSIVYMFCKNYNLPFPKEAFERKTNKLPSDQKDARHELDKTRTIYEKLVTITNAYIKDKLKQKDNVR